MALLRVGMTARLLVVLACLVGAPSVFAETAVVTLADGRRLEGELVEQNDQRIVLRISGIDTPLAREQIRTLEVQRSVEEEYRERKAALNPNDRNGRFDLASWLLQEGAYDLAMREAEELAQIEPDSERVRTLAAAIESRRAMAEESAAAGAGRRTGEAGGAAEQPDEAGELPLLDEEQINLIKVWELPEDLSQAQVRIRVPREVLERAFMEYGHLDVVPSSEEARRQLLRASSQEQLAFLYSLGAAEPQARSLYRHVDVVGDPEAITSFRRTVYGNYIQRYFRRLFGGGQVSGFRLVGPQSNTNAEVYTNFLILTQTNIDGHPMINRLSPADSLLLQWGLPRDAALLPAPAVEGWRPFFAGPDDPAFQRIAVWIDSLYDGPQVDYGIEYPGIRQDAGFGTAEAAPAETSPDASPEPAPPVQRPAESE